MDYKSEMRQLRDTLNEAGYKYYVLDAPEMADHEYDRLLRRLEELEAAQQAALDYYAGTVFDVTELVFEEQMASTASFTVKCSKGGVAVDPDRSIVLELQDGIWTVVSEGY